MTRPGDDASADGMSATRPVIIDCDPGVDDAFALAMAHASDLIEIQAVTTTYGNVGLDHTTNNALRVLEWIGSDSPVYPGVAASLLTDAVNAANYHGATGLDAPAIPQPTRRSETRTAITFLIEHLRSVATPRTIIVLGPHTNLAMALRTAPDIADKIDTIVFMGGSTDYGNDSPAAEFNLMSDPHAAQIVLSSGVPTVMFGLNVTHRVIATPSRIDELRQIGNRSAPVFADLLDRFARVYLERYGFAGPAMHDPCTIAWLLKPELFTTELMRVDVDTSPGLSYGRTVHDRWGLSDRPANCQVAVDVDAGGFFDLITTLITRLP
jgi:purine nucleosidase